MPSITSWRTSSATRMKQLVDAYDEDCQLCAPGQAMNCASGEPAVCLPGLKTCGADQRWGDCQATIAPDSQEELCGNGLDDDCDGAADAYDEDCQLCSPGASEPCTTTAPGVCAEGDQTCQRRSDVWDWSGCTLRVLPGAQAELCDNSLDDDCDGLTDAADEDCQACTPDVSIACASGLPGVCSSGSKTCQADGSWGACAAEVTPGAQVELCGNGLDDDCDGATDSADDDCGECTPQATRPCQTAFPGVCSAGTQTCSAQGSWGSCVGTILPGSQPENCGNGLDDDCDGAQDQQDSDCTVCGNGLCEGSENSFACPQDCCDRFTPCEQTRQNQGQVVCRQTTAEGEHEWVSVTTMTGLCSQPSHLCTSVARCNGWTYYCKDLEPASWEQSWINSSCQCGDGYCTNNGTTQTETGASCPGDCGPCVCGDGTCSAPAENGASCPQDCCDNSTDCDFHQMIDGVERWCRNINSGGYRWTSEAETIASCNEASEYCNVTARCDGKLLYCKPGPAWPEQACSCGDGFCTENGDTCPTDCCDAYTSCNYVKTISGVGNWCRNINSGGYRWTTLAQATAACDQPSEIYSSTARCDGNLYYCSAINPANWTPTCP